MTMAMRISPWLQGVAERQLLREFSPEDPRVQNVFRRVIDQIIHFFAQRLNNDYTPYYDAERGKRLPSAPDSSGVKFPISDPSLTFEDFFLSRVTYEVFKDPVISLSDCNIYENREIETEIENRRPSLYDATPFDDNRYFKDPLVLKIIEDPNHKIPNCPLTGAPFTQPFYCVEDGHTYDKQAILNWATDAERVPIGVKDDAIVYGISTPFHPAKDLPQLTLIPHALIFKTLSIKLAEPRAARCVIEIGEAGIITPGDFKGNIPS